MDLGLLSILVGGYGMIAVYSCHFVYSRLMQIIPSSTMNDSTLRAAQAASLIIGALWFLSIPFGFLILLDAQLKARRQA